MMTGNLDYVPGRGIYRRVVEEQKAGERNRSAAIQANKNRLMVQYKAPYYPEEVLIEKNAERRNTVGLTM